MADTARDFGNVKDRIQDPAPAVRRAIAANPHTPRQADTILAKDTDYGVRCELARKIVGTGLGDDERSEL